MDTEGFAKLQTEAERLLGVGDYFKICGFTYVEFVPKRIQTCGRTVTI